MSRSAPDRCADLVAPRWVRSGISTRERMRWRTRSAPSASRLTGPAMVRASRIDSTTMTPSRMQEQLDDLQPLGLDRLVDVAALGRQQQRAAHRAEALHRHRDRDDDLAAIGRPAPCRRSWRRPAPAPPRDSPCRRPGRARGRAADRRSRATSGTRSSRA